MRRALILALVLAGCSPSLRQQVMNASADVLVEHQEDREAFYRSQHQLCLDALAGSPSWAEAREGYRSCMEPSRIVARSADAFERALLVAQDAQNAGNASDFADALPDLISAAANLIRALQAAALRVPPEIRAIADLVVGDQAAAEAAIGVL